MAAYRDAVRVERQNETPAEKAARLAVRKEKGYDAKYAASVPIGARAKAQQKYLASLSSVEKERRRLQSRARYATRRNVDPAGQARYYRNHTLKSKYGITADKFDQILASQGGLCACCRENGSGRPFTMDHCHKTGVNREILCHRCNSAVGHLRESTEIARLVILYMEKHQCQRSK